MDAFQLEVDPPKNEGKAVRRAAVRGGPSTFAFDSIFDEHSTQEDVFAECVALVAAAIDGFNVTVFAYGQTGAGKTHTMYGSGEMPGLVPRAADELFAVLGRYSHGSQSKVCVSMFELYRDDLMDLILPKSKV